MKKIKSGFTLSELLLCVGIIAIVSAMGMTIARQGTERAYNLYFSTGYINLYNAIGEIGGILQQPPNQQQQQICSLFDGGNYTPANRTCTTRNNINYTFDHTNLISDYITMSVPARVTRANPNGNATTRLYYDASTGLLIPTTAGLNPNDVDMQNRLDLLRVYIDNGTVGRVAMNGRPMDEITYMTYHDAYCKNYAIDIKDTNYNNITNCTNFGNTTGVLRFAPPRR